MLEETFPFHEGTSFLHRADPRGKVLCAFLLVFAIADLRTLIAALIAFLAGGFFLHLARLPPAKVIKRILVVNTFVVFLWLFLPFSVPGREILSVWKWSATVEGIKLALLITIKCNAALLIIISFVTTTPAPMLGFALASLRLPVKLTLLMLISYRYLNVILEEYYRLLEAAEIRGFIPKTNMHTYRTYAYLLAMVLIRSYERGVRVYQAMVLRGFNGKFYSLHRFQFRGGDLLLMIGIALCIIFLYAADNFIAISRFF